MNFRATLLIAILVTVSTFAAVRLAGPVTAVLPTTDPNSQSVVTLKRDSDGKSKLALREGREAAAVVGDSPRAVVAADFDSDGVADFVVADESGVVRFLKGSSRYLTEPESEPFAAAANAAETGVMPEFFEHGDFNGDGRQDLVAARSGERWIAFLAGLGNGFFAPAQRIEIGGALSTVAVGEFGRPDGQTDVVVGEIAKQGPRLRVFEHPGGAFKHSPELIPLPEAARFAAMGFLGADGYSDIALGGDSRVVIVQGRGQVTPWDSLRPKEIVRPKALVSSRPIAGGVAGIAIGQFDAGRELSLAVLTKNGAIQTFASSTREKTTNSEASAIPSETRKTVSFLPSEVESPDFAVNNAFALRDKVKGTDPNDRSLATLDPIERRRLEDEERKREAEEFARLSPEEREAFITNVKSEQAENDRQSRLNFLQTVAAVPLSFGEWNEKTVVRDSRLIGGRGFGRARVGFSGKDDLILYDAVAKRINVVAEMTGEAGIPATEIFSFDAETEPVAALPVRINLDAKSDLVVLRKGSSRPTFMLSQPSLAVVVNSNLDGPTNCQDTGGTCTLRSAIELANSFPGTQITFNISGSPTIVPQSQLPGITGNGTVISAATADGPTVEIDGSEAGFADGLKIRTSDAVVAGFAINSFNGFYNGEGSVVGGNGITIESTAVFRNSGNNWVFGNYLGTDLTGTIDKGNFVGLNLFDTHDNLIGHTDSLFVQIISGNGDRVANEDGLGIIATNSIRGRFYGNIVGVDATGQTALPNLLGVFLSGSNNDFGGDGTGEGNLVSGNRAPELSGFGTCTGEGIFVVTLFSVDGNGNPVDRLTFGNLIQGNFIGTDGSGTADLGNCREGILLSPDTATSIGSVTETGRNTVSGNGFGGISCIDVSAYISNITTDFGFCAISGNNVGTDVFGNVGIPNDFEGAIGGFNVVTLNGINVYHNLNFGVVGLPIGFDIGGSCTGLCNLVNGPIFRSGHNGDVGIFSNYVGTNKTGVISLTNYPTSFSVSGGIQASRGNTTIGDYGSIDGVPTSFGNLISGNYCGGLLLSSSIRDNAFGLLSAKANLIGTDAAGLDAIPNNTAGTANCGEGGVRLGNFYGNIDFGGTTPETKNIVAGNLGNGINVGNEAGRLEIKNTYIGVNINQQPLGNSEDGIQLFGAGQTIIGGTAANRRNIIRHNAEAGIAALAGFGATVHNLTIVGNSIYANGELGIDLMRVDGTFPFPNDGVNQNDCYDPDQGANSRQNFPEMITPVFNGDGTVTVTGVLRSTPLEEFRLDFYSSTAADVTDYGEGENYIGTLNVMTDGNGFSSFSFTSPGTVSSSDAITATATNSNGETSEFSCAAGVCTGLIRTVEELREQFGGFQCQEPLVVNVDNDEDDADANDGVCDTDVSQTNGPQCSLRAAIQHAATMTESSVVANFDIPGAGVHIIQPQTALPTITKTMYLQADTQPGYNGTPLIEVRGDLAPDGTSGLRVESAANGTRIRGFAINRFHSSGILLSGTNDVRIDGNYLGMDADGVSFDPNRIQGAGLTAIGGRNNQIGRTTGNLISGNTGGITFTGGGGNTLLNNRIGMDKNGAPLLVNGEPTLVALIGVLVDGSNDNTIGTGQPNFIGGNIAGILISGASSANNAVKSNLIGTTPDGLSALPNQVGIFVNLGAHDNIIGGPTNGADGDESNLISGSVGGTRSAGIFIDANAGTSNKILGNVVGLDRAMTARIANLIGVVVLASGTQVGDSTVAGTGNYANSLVVAGNDLMDVNVANSSNVTVTNVLAGISPVGPTFDSPGGIVLDNVQASVVRRSRTSGHSNGIGIAVISGSSGNRIENNCVGCPTSPDTVSPRNSIGIANVGSSDNRYSGNTVVNSSTFGISVGSQPSSPLNAIVATGLLSVPTGTSSDNNQIFGNKIGFLSGGVAPNTLGGVAILDNAHNNVIGGSAPEKANVISGNTSVVASEGYGVFIGLPAGSSSTNYPTGNIVLNNRIGVTATTNDPLPNNYGVVIDKAQNNVIGDENYGNFIGGNIYDGVRVMGAVSTGNSIIGNTVVGNGGSGVVIDGVGGGAPRNAAPEGTPLAVLRKNRIGVILNGQLGTVFSNQGDGVKILNSFNVVVGDFGQVLGNALCAALGNGIRIDASSAIRVVGNRIGTDQVGTPNCGNSQNGVLITNGSSNNTVGGPEEGSGNTITDNGGDGVEIDETAGEGNLVDPNSIFGNGGLGIDLNLQGSTPNDPLDADGGANRGQNYPTIDSYGIDSNGDLIVSYSVDSQPGNSDYGPEGLYIEFFEADAGGEGRNFLGSARYLESDFNGAFAGIKIVNLGNAAALGFVTGERITATATDAQNNTSEFTPAFVPTAAGVEISGRVVDSAMNPLANAVVMLQSVRTGAIRTARTNSFGRFGFDDVPAGEVYMISARSKSQSFANNDRLIQIDDNIADLDFVAEN